MVRISFALALLLAWLVPCALAQSGPKKTEPPRSNPSLGLFCTSVPEPLYVHLCAFVPKLHKGSGLLIRQVKVDSAADQLGLKRHDILLSLGGKTITDTDQLVSLIRSQKPNRDAPLVLIRAGKQMTLEVNLAEIKDVADNVNKPDARGKAKKGHPPEVTVKATSIGNRQLEVTFEYYAHGKCKQVICTGTLDEIETQVKNLPMPVQDFARVALNRLRNRKQ